MHVTHWGRSGPRVVLVHGGAQGTSTAGEANFRGQEILGEQGWQLIVPDRPGHGRSPDPGRPDDAEADGALIAGLLGEGAHLVGHSFGGAVALAAAAQKPASVKSLTVIEPAMQSFAIRDWRVKRMLLRMVAAMAFSRSPAKKARRIMKVLGTPPELQNNATEAELIRMGEAIGRARLPNKATLALQLTGMKVARIPFLVVSGGWGLGVEATCDIVASAGGGERAVVPCEHHFPQWNSEAFNAVLARFMARVEGKTK